MDLRILIIRKRLNITGNISDKSSNTARLYRNHNNNFNQIFVVWPHYYNFIMREISIIVF